MDSFTEWLLWLENSTWATSIKKSLWLYPFIEIIHIIGILFVAGAAILFDFRLLGLSKRGPIVDAAKNLLPWSLRGLILAIPSGVLLFTTNAGTLANDITFQVKLSLLALAGVNALIFRSVVYKRWLSTGSEPIKLPLLAKLNGVISIVLWFSIIACGRLLAY